MKKIIVVTGASSGMGVCFAKQLAVENPDELWIVARRKDRLEDLKKEIEPENKTSVRVVDMDISGAEGARRLNSVFLEEKSRGDFEISVLVNNAGFGTYGEFANTDVNREMEMVDLDCTSLTGITGFALP